MKVKTYTWTVTVDMAVDFGCIIKSWALTKDSTTLDIKHAIQDFLLGQDDYIYYALTEEIAEKIYKDICKILGKNA